MPRIYVRKTTASYSDASMALALKAVEGGKSIYAASLEYDIPYPTLRRWVVNKPNHRGQGREAWLTKDEEKCIVDSLKFLAECGYPFDRSDLSNIIRTYFEFPNSRASPFGDKPPGPDYLRNFEKRWSKELTKRKPEILTKTRASNLTEATVDIFFKKYTSIIEENGLQGHPERIFNLDEAGLGTDPRNSAVFVSKTSRNTYMMSPTCGKTMFSVLFCISASGNYLPPFTVYKGAHLYESWTKNGPLGGLYAVTESGWMQDSVFESWMKHFVRHTEDLQKPILLIYDGHGSHMTYCTIATARDNGIIILCLPPHTSHALQPLDVGVFAPLKKSWKEILKKWFRESRLQNVSKAVFPILLKQLTQKFSSQNAMKGFKGCGLYPVNKSEIQKRFVVQVPQDTDTLPSTSMELTETPSVQKEANNRNSTSKTIVGSPLKELKLAIISTLSPPASNETKIALNNSKAKRKRVQATTGEVLTEDMVAARLQEEHEVREKKKTCPSSKIEAKKSTAVTKKSINKIIQNDSSLTPLSNKISAGSWVRVKYYGKKSFKNFIGQILSTENNKITVKYLVKSPFGQKYTFPEKDDVDEVESEQITQILDEPMFDSRGHYTFNFLN